MSSGVLVNRKAEDAIDGVKSRKMGIVLFCINDALTEIIVDREFGPQKNGEEGLKKLKEELPKDQPRYALVDFSFCNEEGHTKEKVLFVSWSPDTSPVKQKMLYASSKKYISKVTSFAKAIQATDFDELDYKEIVQKCLKL